MELTFENNYQCVCEMQYRVAKTHRMPHLSWPFFRKRALELVSLLRNSSCNLRHLMGLCHHVVCCSLELTATHCNTRCNTLQHTATHCTTLQHTATHCNTPQHTATQGNTLQHTATHCNTL